MALTRPPVANAFANTVAGTPSDLWNVPSYLDSGFPDPSGIPVRPPLGFFNWLFWFCMLGVRYLLSRAFTPWDSTETQYTAGSMVQDSDGRFYICRGSATTGTHPSADSNWLPLNMLDRVPNVASGGDRVSKISRWVSPRGQSGFCLNRWALPDTNYYQYKEMWIGTTNWGGISLSGGISGPWNFIGTGAATAVSSHNPGIAVNQNASDTAPSLELMVDSGSSSNKLAVILQPLSKMNASALMIAKFQSAFITAHASNKHRMGFLGLGETIDNIQNGAYFLADSGGTADWICVTVSGGTSTSSATSVPIVAGTSGAHDFDVVLVGSGVDDTGAPHALFYVDGELVNDITTNVPNSSGSPQLGGLVFGNQAIGAGGANQSIVVGPVTYTQITEPSTP